MMVWFEWFSLESNWQYCAYNFNLLNCSKEKSESRFNSTFACVIWLKYNCIFCTFTRCHTSVKMSTKAQHDRDLPCIFRILAVATIQLLNSISRPSNSLFTVNRSSSCHRQNYGHTVVWMSNTWCMRAIQDILASRFTTIWFDGS